MSSVGTSKGILEIAKFGFYVAVPIGLMYTFANNSTNIKKFMGNGLEALYGPIGFVRGIEALYGDFAVQWREAFTNHNPEFDYFVVVQRSYVVYPEEAPRPPSPEELREMARELARKKNIP